MKSLRVVLLLFASSFASSLRADTLFSNIGELGSVSYQQDQHVFDAGFSDTFFYTANMVFTVSHDYSGMVNLYLPIFSASTGSAPGGIDSNNNCSVVLSLTLGSANEIWRSGVLCPSFLLNNLYDFTHPGSVLFHIETGNLQLQTGAPYVLTAIPAQTNTTNFWYLGNDNQPGLIVTTTPEPGSFALLGAGMLWLLLKKNRK